MDRLPSGSVFVSPLAQFSMSPDTPLKMSLRCQANLELKLIPRRSAVSILVLPAA